MTIGDNAMDSLESFMAWMRHILKSRCHAKFDTQALTSRTSLQRGEYQLSPRKWMELVATLEETFDLALPNSDLTAANLESVATIYNMVIQRKRPACAHAGMEGS